MSEGSEGFSLSFLAAVQIFLLYLSMAHIFQARKSRRRTNLGEAEDCYPLG